MESLGHELWVFGCSFLIIPSQQPHALKIHHLMEHPVEVRETHVFIPTASLKLCSSLNACAPMCISLLPFSPCHSGLKYLKKCWLENLFLACNWEYIRFQNDVNWVAEIAKNRWLLRQLTEKSLNGGWGCKKLRQNGTFGPTVQWTVVTFMCIFTFLFLRLASKKVSVSVQPPFRH